MSSAASDDPVKVFCGSVEGMLDPTRFGPGCKSRCIEHRGRWLTPPEFEKLAGMSRHYRWRRNIKTETGTRFGELMESGFLTECAKNCSCDVCDGDGVVGATQKSSQNHVLSDATSLNVSRDTDSDSGISTVSSTKNHNQNTLLKPISPSTSTSLASPTDMEDSSKESISYPSMVQEAIASLASGRVDCTNLNILLYILNRHKPREDVFTVNTKVLTALRFLTRMGFIKKTNDEGCESDLSDVEDATVVEASAEKTNTSTKSKSKENIDTSKKESNTTAAPNKTDKSSKALALQKAEQLKAKAKGVVCTKKSLGHDGVKREIIFKPKKLSPALAAICGKKKLTRQEALKRVWRYIKQRKLQDPSLKTSINCDDKLKLVMKKKKVDQREMFSLLNPHMTDV